MTPDSVQPDPRSSDPIGEDALSAYLDDELDATTRVAVEARLADSPEWRAVLEELRETRDALRALPSVDGAPAFWARILGDAAVVDLAAERRARRFTGWRVAIAGVAAAIVVVAVGVALVPERERIKPAVATFADQHAVRSSIDNDALSQLASVGVPGFER